VSAAPAPKGAAGVSGENRVPRHVAIIMDGNGRWAAKRGLPRAAGHKAGAEAVRRAMRAAVDNGVEVLTLYAFSSENWKRSSEEIADLTSLMRFYLDRELASLAKEGVKLRLIGDYSAFGPEMVKRLERAVDHTAGNSRLILVVACCRQSGPFIDISLPQLSARTDDEIDDSLLRFRPFVEMIVPGKHHADVVLEEQRLERAANLWIGAVALA